MEENDAGVPEAVDETIQQFGIFIPPNKDKLPSAEQEIFDNALAGRCMTCSAECGATTFAVIGQPPGLSEPAVIMLFCGGPCLTDMQVMGWLQEAHADVNQRIAFRGGHGGN